MARVYRPFLALLILLSFTSRFLPKTNELPADRSILVLWQPVFEFIVIALFGDKNMQSELRISGSIECAQRDADPIMLVLVQRVEKQ